MRKLVVLLTLTALLSVSTAWAVDTIKLVEGKSFILNISKKDANLIKFPGHDSVKVYTSSQVLSVKVEGKNIFLMIHPGVKYEEADAGQEQAQYQPEQFFIVADEGTYSFIAIPKDIPAQMYIAQSEGKVAKAAEWEKERDYITLLKDLIKAIVNENPPNGYQYKERAEKVSAPIKNTEVTMVGVYEGATLTGEVYHISNLGEETLILSEQNLYGEGVMAVALSASELPPSGTAMSYIVRKRPGVDSVMVGYQDPLATTRKTAGGR